MTEEATLKTILKLLTRIKDLESSQEKMIEDLSYLTHVVTTIMESNDD